MLSFWESLDACGYESSMVDEWGLVGDLGCEDSSSSDEMSM